MTTEINSDSSDDDFAKAFQPLIDTNMFFVTLNEPTESHGKTCNADQIEELQI